MTMSLVVEQYIFSYFQPYIVYLICINFKFNALKYRM